MKCSLALSNFLEDISSLPHCIAFLCFLFCFVLCCFLHGSLNKAFISLLAILWILHSDGYIFPFVLCTLLLFFHLFVRPSQKAIFHCCISASWGWFFSPPPVQTSIHSSSGTLSDLVPWIFLSFLLCNHKSPNGLVVFPAFFKSEFHNKDLMIWATVSFQSWFCQLYRASLSLTAKNIIILISVLTISWCPCIQLSLVFLKKVFVMTHVFSCQNSFSLSPASFRTPRPNLPVTSGIFLFLPCIPVPCMKSRFFWFLQINYLCAS